MSQVRFGMRGVALVAAGLLAALAIACTPETQVTVTQGEPTGISATGLGKVSVIPDIAEVSLGVEVTRPTVAEARDVAADLMTAVRDSLLANGVAERDIQTQFFNIYPQFRYINGREPEITGYAVANIVRAKIRDLDRVSQTLDEAVRAGGNQIRVHGIQFTVDEPERYYDEARQLAVADAREKAQRLATLAGVSLGKVKTIAESTNGQVHPPIPFAGRAAQDSAAETPIAPGETEIRLTVFLVYEVD
jgi:uncharacterized protein